MAGSLPLAKSDRAEAPLVQGNLLDLEKCNENTQMFMDERNERVVYVFNYKDVPLNRLVLKKLKDQGRWDVIKHPFVFNYLNEVLVNAGLMYTLHVATYFFFLFLLYSYIHTKPSFWNNALVTALVFLFVFFLVTKARLKAERDSCAVSVWFLSAYLFTFFTYLVTLAFVWLPLLFSYDDFNEELKRSVTWFLPIVAIIASWIQCLHVLRKAPCGPYIMMMSKILKSFLNTTIIWIPTLLCFAFSFQLVMRDSGTTPWDDPIIAKNASLFMTLFQSFTKTSAMMIGEVEANDILERRAWVANLLLIFFEVITVILLMNLMISLAVGDVNELRSSADERLLRIKTNFVIEQLHLSEFLDCCCWTPLYKHKINNVCVISRFEGSEFSCWKPLDNRASFPAPKSQQHKVYDLTLNAEHVNLETSSIDQTLERLRVLGIKEAHIRVTEVMGSGIAAIQSHEFREELANLRDDESCFRKYKRWLIGLNWQAFLKL